MKRIQQQPLALLFFIFSFSHAQSQETLAVLDLMGRGISMNEVGSLSDRLRTELVRTNLATIVERGQMEQILLEQDYSMSGCFSDECAVEIGQLLGVTKMIAGSIGKVGGTYSIDIRVISVETGEIEVSFSRDYNGKIDGLLGEMALISSDIVESFGNSDPLKNQVEGSRQTESPSLKSPIIPPATTIAIDSLFNIFTEDALRSIELGDSVYIIDRIFNYKFSAAKLVGMGQSGKRLQVEINGKLKKFYQNDVIKRYDWIVHANLVQDRNPIDVGDKVIYIGYNDLDEEYYFKKGIIREKLRSNRFLIYVNESRSSDGFIKRIEQKVRLSAIFRILPQ